MTAPYALPPARLYTTWGTVLYVETASGQLRHGAIETSPANAVFVSDPASTQMRRQGWIMHASGERLDPIVCGALSCRSVSGINGGDPPPTPTLLELVPLERGLIALRASGLFLCAQPDGRLDIANPWCSTWECFLASQDWCSAMPVGGDGSTRNQWDGAINRKEITKFIVDARLRAKANTASRATKVLIFGYTSWSHGRVYYDLCTQLQKQNYIIDIINWQERHNDYIGELLSFYDFVISALDGISILVDVYAVPYDRIIALSHHEMDIRALIDQKGIEVFEKFAGYGVVSYQLYDASAIFGVTRHPLVVQLGVNFDEFCAEIPEQLTTVGYAGSYSHKTIDGIEIKRGDIAEAAVREAGLAFKVAGWTGDQISFHDMPEFYRSVDAVLISSVTEGAQMPVKEGAATGRLVISTPVGDFPLRASQGVGIVAPIESHKYRKFVADTLKYYRENPAAFVEICRKTQDAARQLDWSNMIGDWVELIETAKGHVLKQARACQEAGRFAEAAVLFASRADSSGDEEEGWYAHWQHARCLRQIGDEEGFVRTALHAFRQRPHRAEPLHDLANYYLDTHQAGPAAFYAEAALAIPQPEHDALFVDPALYDFGLKHTFSAAASWCGDPELKERGRKVCDWLALDRKVPGHIREPARCNSGWFAVPAQSLMPSLRFRALKIKAPDEFHPANLSICRYGDGFVAIVRTVNWVLKDGFWYVLQGSPPYRSHLLFLRLDDQLRVIETADVLPPEDIPVPENCEAGLHHDLGFADPRPFIWRDDIWCISIVRQLNEQSRSEMVLSRIEISQTGRYKMTDWRVVPSGMPARDEKNWMPQLVGDELRLIYSVDPTRILADSGAVLHDESAPIVAEGFRGGSQALPFDGGWLMVVHEVENVNGQRRYFHRFIWMDSASTLRRVSRRFYLCSLGTEFVAGISWHPDDERIVMSFSVNDADPSLAIINADDIRSVLLAMTEHEQASQDAVSAGRAVLEAISSSDMSVTEWNPRSEESAGQRGDASGNESEHAAIERDELIGAARPHGIVSVFNSINVEDEFLKIKDQGLSHLTDLCNLMSYFGSDKGKGWHNYTVVYDWLFSGFRNEELTLFELGLGTNKVGAPSSMGPEGKPGASLRAWREYFPRALIYGADIDADTLFQEDRIRTFWTDQREPRAIRSLWDELNDVAFDIMVDDGLHEASANIGFFMESLRKLKPGGIYVIEDITPHDADLLRSFARRIARISKSIVCEELDHPVNKLDNRLLIFQRT